MGTLIYQTTSHSLLNLGNPQVSNSSAVRLHVGPLFERAARQFAV